MDSSAGSGKTTKPRTHGLPSFRETISHGSSLTILGNDDAKQKLPIVMDII